MTLPGEENLQQLVISELHPPLGSEEAAMVFRFKAPNEQLSDIVIGVQGILILDKDHPLIIQLPSWCGVRPPDIKILDQSKGGYEWEIRPATGPYTILWPQYIQSAEYKVPRPALRVYFGRPCPMLAGNFK